MLILQILKNVGPQITQKTQIKTVKIKRHAGEGQYPSFWCVRGIRYIATLSMDTG
jgi:hypothetical protein